MIKKLDFYTEKVLGILNGIFVFAMFVIVNIQVLIRYVFQGGLGAISDITVYLLVYAVFFSAVLAVKHDDHLKIDIVDSLIKNKKALEILRTVLKLLMFVAMIIFCFYCWKHEINLIQTGNADPATKLPYWGLNLVMPISSTLMAFYYGLNTYKGVRNIMKGGADE